MRYKSLKKIEGSYLDIKITMVIIIKGLSMGEKVIVFSVIYFLLKFIFVIFD